MPRMSDVAARAGVSHQTVSRVLNGMPGVRDVDLHVEAVPGPRHCVRRPVGEPTHAVLELCHDSPCRRTDA